MAGGELAAIAKPTLAETKETAVVLQWEAPVGVDVKKYIIVYRQFTDKTPAWKDAPTLEVDGKETQYSLSGLEISATYQCRVAYEVEGGARSPWSDTLSADTANVDCNGRTSNDKKKGGCCVM